LKEYSVGRLELLEAANDKGIGIEIGQNEVGKRWVQRKDAIVVMCVRAVVKSVKVRGMVQFQSA
jgi:hypothetical protein